MKPIYLLLTATLLTATSCVTAKKFKLSEGERLETARQNQSLQQSLSLSRVQNGELERNLNSLKQDTSELGKRVRRYDQLLNSKMDEHQKLSAIFDQRMKELEEREQTIDQMQSMINAQNDRVHQILSSVQNALLGFNSDDLTVSQRDGKVYIAISDKLLFQSGSATLDKKGKEAIGKVAEVLNLQSDIDVFIEGHTDDRPISTAQFKDNFDLSVIRATSVSRILIKEYGVQPLQLLPCGRGEYMPVANNQTPEGRSKNRRTEIIIAPKIDKLLEILQ